MVAVGFVRSFQDTDYLCEGALMGEDVEATPWFGLGRKPGSFEGQKDSSLHRKMSIATFDQVQWIS
jgi:hypothetical protein